MSSSTEASDRGEPDCGCSFFSDSFLPCRFQAAPAECTRQASNAARSSRSSRDACCSSLLPAPAAAGGAAAGAGCCFFSLLHSSDDLRGEGAAAPPASVSLLVCAAAGAALSDRWPVGLLSGTASSGTTSPSSPAVLLPRTGDWPAACWGLPSRSERRTRSDSSTLLPARLCTEGEGLAEVPAALAGTATACTRPPSEGWPAAALPPLRFQSRQPRARAKRLGPGLRLATRPLATPGAPAGWGAPLLVDSGTSVSS